MRIFPSLLAADFARLADEVRRVEQAGADGLHLDVMDGHFVPNLTMGPALAEHVRRVTRLPLDVHLMLMEPERYVGVFLEAGVDSISVHAEALAFDHSRRPRERGYVLTPGCKEPLDAERTARVLEPIRRAGKKAGLALNPGTPAEAAADGFDYLLAMTVWPGFSGQSFIPEVVPKIAALRARFPSTPIQVDGGISPATVGACAAAGADWFVAGAAIFRAPDPAAALRELRSAAGR